MHFDNCKPNEDFSESNENGNVRLYPRIDVLRLSKKYKHFGRLKMQSSTDFLQKAQLRSSFTNVESI